jgi:hypothetical protein
LHREDDVAIPYEDLVNETLAIPDALDAAGKRLTNARASLLTAKESLKTREAALMAGSEKPHGQELTGTVDVKKAKIFELTEPERMRVSVSEGEVQDAEAELQRITNRFTALRAVSRFAYAATGAQLGA